jgi:ABC-2 type transport system ATP-binding protein
VAALLGRLRDRAGVRQATIFGDTIHALVDEDHSLAELGLADVEVQPTEANLEDVFVTLTKAQTNNV